MMKSIIRNVLIGLFTLVFASSQSLINLKATMSYPMEATPKIQVKVAVGSTTLNQTTFLKDLKVALVTRGIDFSLLDLNYTAKTAFNPADKSLWDFYDHEGEWGEIGVSSSILTTQKAKDYLIANEPGFNPTTMRVISYGYQRSRNGYVINYNNGSTIITVPWPVLDTSYADIAAHPMNYDQLWYSGIWKTDAIVFLATNAPSYYSLNTMEYDASKGKVFLNYYNSSYDQFFIEWPAGLPFVQTYAIIDFTNDTITSNSNNLSVRGLHGPSDNVAFQVNYRFSPSLLGYKHYPEPDSNPDNDNPVDWLNDSHIVTRDNGNVLVFYGYGAPAFKDFMLSKSDSIDRKEITFDLNEEGIQAHSMQGGGFLFNIQTEDDGTGKLLMSGYAILFQSVGIGLYKINHVNVNDFHEERSSLLGSIAGVTLLGTYTKDTETLHAVKIIIENNILNFYDNDIQPITNYALPVVYGNRFGPLAAYNSHGCSQLSYFTLSNLKMSTVSTVVKSIDQVVDELTWENDAKHYMIYLEENIDANLDAAQINAIGTKLKAASAAYLAVGSITNQEQQLALISANNSLGLFIPQTDADVINQIADYIFAKVHPIIIPNIVDLEIVKLGKPYILKAGDTSTTVTGNITFLNPLESYTGSTVKWTSSKPSYLSDSGIVKQPSFTSGDGSVVASMEVTFEGITIKKDYPLTISKLPITPTETLALDVASLAIIYANGDNAESVTKNLGFSATLPQGSNVVWSTNKPSVVTASGIVNRSSFTIGDQAVLITALISSGGETQTKTFDVIVKKLPASSSEKLALDSPYLTIVYAKGDTDKSVTGNLGFSATLPQGSKVVWSTNKPSVVTASGIVNRSSFTIGDQAVLITALISSGGETQTKTFDVIVKKLPASSSEKLALDSPYLTIVYAEGDTDKSVTGDLGFKASLPQGSTVLWTTDKPTIIKETGNVVRPTFSIGDQAVLITAVVINGSATQTSKFNVNVVKNAKSGLEKAEEDGKGIIDYADGEDETNVKTIVQMTKIGVNGSTITWTTSHPDILTESGIVSRPKKGDVEVALTATIKNGDTSIVKTFRVMAKQDETPKSSLNDYLPYLLILVIISGIGWFVASKKQRKATD